MPYLIPGARRGNTEEIQDKDLYSWLYEQIRQKTPDAIKSFLILNQEKLKEDALLNCASNQEQRFLVTVSYKDKPLILRLTLLELAALYGDTDTLDSVLSFYEVTRRQTRDVLVKQKDEIANGYNLLHLALFNVANPQVVGTLLKYSPDAANVRSTSNKLPIEVAFENDRTEHVRTLCDFTDVLTEKNDVDSKLLALIGEMSKGRQDLLRAREFVKGLVRKLTEISDKRLVRIQESRGGELHLDRDTIYDNCQLYLLQMYRLLDLSSISYEQIIQNETIKGVQRFLSNPLNTDQSAITLDSMGKLLGGIKYLLTGQGADSASLKEIRDLLLSNGYQGDLSFLDTTTVDNNRLESLITMHNRLLQIVHHAHLLEGKLDTKKVVQAYNHYVHLIPLMKEITPKAIRGRLSIHDGYLKDEVIGRFSCLSDMEQCLAGFLELYRDVKEMKEEFKKIRFDDIVKVDLYDKQLSDPSLREKLLREIFSERKKLAMFKYVAEKYPNQWAIFKTLPYLDTPNRNELIVSFVLDMLEADGASSRFMIQEAMAFFNLKTYDPKTTAAYKESLLRMCTAAHDLCDIFNAQLSTSKDTKPLTIAEMNVFEINRMLYFIRKKDQPIRIFASKHIILPSKEDLDYATLRLRNEIANQQKGAENKRQELNKKLENLKAKIQEIIKLDGSPERYEATIDFLMTIDGKSAEKYYQEAQDLTLAMAQMDKNIEAADAEIGKLKQSIVILRQTIEPSLVKEENTLKKLKQMQNLDSGMSEEDKKAITGIEDKIKERRKKFKSNPLSLKALETIQEESIAARKISEALLKKVESYFEREKQRIETLVNEIKAIVDGHVIDVTSLDEEVREAARPLTDFTTKVAPSETSENHKELTNHVNSTLQVAINKLTQNKKDYTKTINKIAEQKQKLDNAIAILNTKLAEFSDLQKGLKHADYSQYYFEEIAKELKALMDDGKIEYVPSDAEQPGVVASPLSPFRKIRATTIQAKDLDELSDLPNRYSNLTSKLTELSKKIEKNSKEVPKVEAGVNKTEDESLQRLKDILRGDIGRLTTLQEKIKITQVDTHLAIFDDARAVIESVTKVSDVTTACDIDKELESLTTKDLVEGFSAKAKMAIQSASDALDLAIDTQLIDKVTKYNQKLAELNTELSKEPVSTVSSDCKKAITRFLYELGESFHTKAIPTERESRAISGTRQYLLKKPFNSLIGESYTKLWRQIETTYDEAIKELNKEIQEAKAKQQQHKQTQDQKRIDALIASLQPLNSAIEQFDQLKQYERAEVEKITQINALIDEIKKHVDLKGKKLLGNKSNEELTQIESNISELKVLLAEVNPTLLSYKNHIDSNAEQQLQKAKATARTNLEKLQNYIKNLLALNAKADGKNILSRLPPSLKHITTLSELSKFNIDNILKANASKDALNALNGALSALLDEQVGPDVAGEFGQWLERQLVRYQTTRNNYDGIKTKDKAEKVVSECDALDKTFTANIHALGLSVDVLQTREAFSELTKYYFKLHQTANLPHADFKRAIDKFKKYVDEHCDAINQKVQSFRDAENKEAGPAKKDYEKALKELKALQARYLKIQGLLDRRDVAFQLKLVGAIREIETAEKTNAKQYRDAIADIVQEKVSLNTAIKKSLETALNNGLEPYSDALRKLMRVEYIDITQIKVPPAVKILYKLLLIEKTPDRLEIITHDADEIAKADDETFDHFIEFFRYQVGVAAHVVNAERENKQQEHVQEKEQLYNQLKGVVAGLSVNLLAWNQKKYLALEWKELATLLQDIEVSKALAYDPEIDKEYIFFLNLAIEKLQDIQRRSNVFIENAKKIELQYQQRVAVLSASLPTLNTAIEQFDQIQQYAKEEEEIKKIAEINSLIDEIKKHIDLKTNKLLGNKNHEELTKIEADVSSLKTSLVTMNPLLSSYKDKALLDDAEQLQKAKSTAREDLEKLQDLIKTLLVLNDKTDGKDLLSHLPPSLKHITKLSQLSKLNIDNILKTNASKDALDALHQALSTYIENHVKSKVSQEFSNWLERQLSRYQTTRNNYDSIKTKDNAENVVSECDVLDKTFSANIHALGLSLDAVPTREVFSDLTKDFFLTHAAIDMPHVDFKRTIDKFKKYVDDHCDAVDQKVQGFKNADNRDINKAKVDYEKALRELRALQARYVKVANQNFEIQPTLAADSTAKQYRDAILLINQDKASLDTALIQALVKMLSDGLEPYRTALQNLRSEEQIDITKVSVPSEVEHLYNLLLIKKPDYLTDISDADMIAAMIAAADDKKFDKFVAQFTRYVAEAATAVDAERISKHQAHEQSHDQQYNQLKRVVAGLSVNLRSWDEKKYLALDGDEIAALLQEIEVANTRVFNPETDKEYLSFIKAEIEKLQDIERRSNTFIEKAKGIENQYQRRVAMLSASLPTLNTAIEQFDQVKQYAKEEEEITKIAEINALIDEIKKHVDLKTKKLLGNKNNEELTKIEADLSSLKTSLAKVNPILLNYKNQAELNAEQQLEESKKTARNDLEKLRGLIKTLLALNNKESGKDILSHLPKSLSHLTTLSKLSDFNIEKITKANPNKETLDALHQDVSKLIEEQVKPVVTLEFYNWLERQLSPYQTTRIKYKDIKTKDNAENVVSECDALDKTFVTNIHALGLSIDAVQPGETFSELTKDLFLTDAATDMPHVDFKRTIDKFKKYVDEHCDAVDRKIQGFKDAANTDINKAKVDYEKALRELRASQARYVKVANQNFEIQPTLAAAIRSIETSKETTEKQYRDAILLINQDKASLDTVLIQALAKMLSDGLEPYRTALQKLRSDKEIDVAKVSVPSEVKVLYNLLLIKKTPDLTDIIPDAVIIAAADDKKFDKFMDNFTRYVAAAASAVNGKKPTPAKPASSPSAGGKQESTPTTTTSSSVVDDLFSGLPPVTPKPVAKQPTAVRSETPDAGTVTKGGTTPDQLEAPSKTNGTKKPKKSKDKKVTIVETPSVPVPEPNSALSQQRMAWTTNKRAHNVEQATDLLLNLMKQVAAQGQFNSDAMKLQPIFNALNNKSAETIRTCALWDDQLRYALDRVKDDFNKAIEDAKISAPYESFSLLRWCKVFFGFAKPNVSEAMAKIKGSKVGKDEVVIKHSNTMNFLNSLKKQFEDGVAAITTPNTRAARGLVLAPNPDSDTVIQERLQQQYVYAEPASEPPPAARTKKSRTTKTEKPEPVEAQPPSIYLDKRVLRAKTEGVTKREEPVTRKLPDGADYLRTFNQEQRSRTNQQSAGSPAPKKGNGGAPIS